MISGRNPDDSHGHCDLDTSASALLEARDVVGKTTGQDKVQVNAACSGGMIAARALGGLAA